MTTQRLDQVLEVDQPGGDGARLPPRREGGGRPVAEAAKGEPLGNSFVNISGDPRLRLAIELEEFGDPDARGQLDEPLLEAQEQVADLGGLGLGLLARDLADGDEVLLALLAEDKAVGAVAFLEAGHGCPQCHRSVVANLLPTRGFSASKGVTSRDVTPYAA